MLDALPGCDPAGEPAFSVRVSDRARHVRLVMTGGGELVVVVPRRFDQRMIPAIVQARLSWIERARARAVERRAAAAAAALEDPFLPCRISLPAMQEEWFVEYRPSRSANGRAAAREVSGDRLVVTAPAGDEQAARRALLAWARRRAAEELPARLEDLAGLHGFRCERVTIRHQRTRWGSCSPRGAISLNLRLLFLDPEMIDHVLLHELCHTREHNHSQRFWALLGTLDPDCATHRRRAREAWRGLPRWLRDGNAAAVAGPRSSSAIP